MEQKNGPFQIYYEDGNIYVEKNYVEGELNGEEKRFYSNGQLNYKTNYNKGRRVGEFFCLRS